MPKRPKVVLGLKYQQKLDAVAAELLQTGKSVYLPSSAALVELTHRKLIVMSPTFNHRVLAADYDGRRVTRRWSVSLTPKGWRAVNERLRALKRLTPAQDMIAF